MTAARWAASWLVIGVGAFLGGFVSGAIFDLVRDGVCP